MRIIGGKYRGKNLRSPESLNIRPTSDRARESVFNILNSRLGGSWENIRLLELFSGSGAFGLEAISRGAEQICLVDIDTTLSAKNAALFPSEKSKIEIIRGDATKLAKIGKKFNLLFADAPYKKGLSELALKAVTSGGWLEEGAVVVIEVEKNEKLVLPPQFTMLDERRYGIAKFIFARFDEKS